MTGYETQSADTSREIEELLFAAYRRLAESVALAGLRERYPDADERELRLRLASRHVPRELLIGAFGWDPEVEGYRGDLRRRRIPRLQPSRRDPGVERHRRARGAGLG